MEKKCCICGKEFNGLGNNANPIRDGICCDSCNKRFVIHARILDSKLLYCKVYEISENGQSFLDLSKKLYKRDFEFISKNQDGDIKIFRNKVTGENVIVCLVK